MSWTVLIAPQAAKQLSKLDKTIGKRIGRVLTALGRDPRPPGCKKLVGAEAWRVRIGDWRVIYQIEDDQLVVLVVRIGHRREVYD